jgi:deoxyuridine 5'-triphosphate nucleotidohydrolase
MFKNRKTDAVSDFNDPNSFLDLYALAYVNYYFTIDKESITRLNKDAYGHCSPGYNVVEYCQDFNIDDYHEQLYKHLVSPETSFEFLDDNSRKRFFVSCILSFIYAQRNKGTVFFTNDRLYTIIEQTVNVPLTRGNNGGIRFNQLSYHDLDLYDHDYHRIYDDYFGNCDLNFLKMHHPNSKAIKFLKTDENAVLPSKKRRSDTGLDITVIKKVKTDQWGNEWYDTGLQLEVPSGYYTELVGRSSLIKKGWQLANCTGIIDESYRNNLMCVFTRLHPDAPSLESELPNRACQLILRKHEKAHAVEVEQLSNTERSGGFGSTGL